MLLLLITAFFMNVHAVRANENVSETITSKNYDWSSVMDAIIEVESNGNPKAKHGNSVGVMQITPLCVADCNAILKSRKSKKRFKLSDRFNVAKSKEMFILIQSKYNPMNNVEQAIRAWNGGIHYSVQKTQRYFERVMKALKK
jgi:hypothetical protein